MAPRPKGISHVVLYAASSWLAGVLALGGLFVFVRHVSAADFGVFTIWNTTTTVVSAGAAQWLRQAVLRYSPRGIKTTRRLPSHGVGSYCCYLRRCRHRRAVRIRTFP